MAVLDANKLLGEVKVSSPFGDDFWIAERAVLLEDHNSRRWVLPTFGYHFDIRIAKLHSKAEMIERLSAIIAGRRMLISQCEGDKWIPAKRLATGGTHVVSGNRVYLVDSPHNKSSLLGNATGLAAHRTKSQTYIAALCELVERHNTLLAWRTGVDDYFCLSKHIAKAPIYKTIKAGNFEYHALGTLEPSPILTCIVILRDKAGRVSCGSAAGLNWNSTITRATCEALAIQVNFHRIVSNKQPHKTELGLQNGDFILDRLTKKNNHIRPLTKTTDKKVELKDLFRLAENHINDEILASFIPAISPHSETWHVTRVFAKSPQIFDTLKPSNDTLPELPFG